MKKITKIIIAIVIVILALLSIKIFAKDKQRSPMKNEVEITVDFSLPEKTISPYIFGINDGASFEQVSPKAIRLGGNRLSAYNWENNKSNAGSDWKNQSDDYLLGNVRSKLKRKPGAAALNVAEDVKEHNVPYSLLTLQMVGYVANKKGIMTKENSLNGEDWCKVVNRKNAPFSLKPDLTDGVVYTDEYLNYLGETIGKSDSKTGFKGYALDNEPGLWHHTHSLIHKEEVRAKELIEKTIDLAKTVKDFDSNADVFGPSLFGYSAYKSLGSDWNLINANNFYKYQWFIDYYLEQMAKAEKEDGRRLLDVLDLHYYTEAKGACGKRKCDHFDNDDCIKARINAVRSLYDADYKEKSWIVDTGAKFFPLLPKIKASIDKYYPGTKLAFTEYNFGGGTDISGAVTQADFLGLLAKNEVYFASIWAFDKAEYQFAAINMFTNYDEKGGYFADSYIESTSSDDYRVSSFVGKNNQDGKIHIILTNKSIHEKTKISLDLGKKGYIISGKYVLDKSGTKIKAEEPNATNKKTKIIFELEPMTVNHFVIE